MTNFSRSLREDLRSTRATFGDAGGASIANRSGDLMTGCDGVGQHTRGQPVVASISGGHHTVLRLGHRRRRISDLLQFCRRRATTGEDDEEGGRPQV